MDKCPNLRGPYMPTRYMKGRQTITPTNTRPHHGENVSNAIRPLTLCQGTWNLELLTPIVLTMNSLALHFTSITPEPKPQPHLGSHHVSRKGKKRNGKAVIVRNRIGERKKTRVLPLGRLENSFCEGMSRSEEMGRSIRIVSRCL